MSSLDSRLVADKPQPPQAAVSFEVEEANQFLAAIVESSDDAIIAESLEGLITSWNSGAEKMFGYPREDAIGQSVSILHSEGDSEELAAILELIRQGRSASHFESTRRRRDGTVISVSVSVSPIRDENNKVIGAAKIIRDITDRKHAEAVIRRTEKLAVAGRLAASVAHEINNPLAALTNLLYLLKGENLSEQGSEFLSMAESELERVAHITTQALGFYQESRPASPHRVHPIIAQALAIHQHRIDTSHIEVEKQCEESISIICHDGEIRQVFVNLIGNALDALDGEGHLCIRVKVVPDSMKRSASIRVLISDNGPGITKEILGRLFEPFTTTKGQTRTGLGLWMCERILIRHHGQIKIKTSQHRERHGTIVCVWLPIS